MAYEVYLRVYARTGDLKLGFLPALWVRFRDRVNFADPIIFAVNVQTSGVDQIDEFDLVEVMLRNRELGLMTASGGFVRAYMGIVRDWTLSTSDEGIDYLEFIAPGLNHVLDWRSVFWYSGFENRSSFANVPAETIVKTLVAYNCTSLASVANGRYRNGDLLPGMGVDLQIGYDEGFGNLTSVTLKGAKVLPSLQRVVENGGGDFQVSWLGSDQYLFEFYPGQLGGDKTSGSERVVFSLANHTMRNPRLIRTGAKSTMAIAAGQGQRELRDWSDAYGPDYSVGYDLELFVNASQENDEEGRVFRGELALADDRVIERLDFEVIQTGNQFYSPVEIIGRQTFKPGDLVLAVYPEPQIRKIDSVEVYWSDPGSDDAFVVDVITREVVLNGS